MKILKKIFGERNKADFKIASLPDSEMISLEDSLEPLNFFRESGKTLLLRIKD